MSFVLLLQTISRFARMPPTPRQPASSTSSSVRQVRPRQPLPPVCYCNISRMYTRAMYLGVTGTSGIKLPRLLPRQTLPFVLLEPSTLQRGGAEAACQPPSTRLRLSHNSCSTRRTGDLFTPLPRACARCHRFPCSTPRCSSFILSKIQNQKLFHSLSPKQPRCSTTLPVHGHHALR